MASNYSLHIGGVQGRGIDEEREIQSVGQEAFRESLDPALQSGITLEEVAAVHSIFASAVGTTLYEVEIETDDGFEYRKPTEKEKAAWAAFANAEAAACNALAALGYHVEQLHIEDMF